MQQGQDSTKEISPRNVVSFLQANGGVINLEDMAWYYGAGINDLSKNQGLRMTEPVRGTYRGYEIVAMPPGSSGGTHIVEMLNILEGIPSLLQGKIQLLNQRCRLRNILQQILHDIEIKHLKGHS
jgi:gamma-glutamyltranspeptidase/glutathione hydrolase